VQFLFVRPLVNNTLIYYRYTVHGLKIKDLRVWVVVPKLFNSKPNTPNTLFFVELVWTAKEDPMKTEEISSLSISGLTELESDSETEDDSDFTQLRAENVVADSGGRFGDPLKHHRFSMFKEGQFSDFKLTWNDETFLLHRCILFSESTHFQSLFSTDWKDAVEGNLKRNDISERAVETFLQFIYTGLITEANFGQLLIELYYLSVYFQVGKLNRFCSENFQRFLTVDTMKPVLTWRFLQNDLKAQDNLADFIARNYEKLVADHFSFHIVGKTVVLKVLQRIAAKQKCSWDFLSDSNHCLGEIIREPSTHPQYSLLLNGKYSDVKIKLAHLEYQLHKCVLFAESGYFQTFLKSDWKESNSGEITISGKEISQNSFEVFLAFLYTGFITEKSLETSLFELYDLSDYFQVHRMKILVLERFKEYLTLKTAEYFLTCVRDREISELKGRMADYLAAHFMDLLKIDFPFHKVGKIMLQRMFKRIAAIEPVMRRTHSVPNQTVYLPVYSQEQCGEKIMEDEDSEIPDF
jgi:hypothetical protein